jgi:NADH-quinone oxidoreductase subunit M
MAFLLWIVLLASLIGFLATALLPRLSDRMYQAIHIVLQSVALVAVGALWSQFHPASSHYQAVVRLPWFSFPDAWHGANLTIGLNFGIDGLSLGLLSLAAVVLWLIAVSTRVPEGLGKARAMWVQLASFAVFATFTALNIFTFLLAIEVTLFATFFLLLRLSEADSQRTAIKFLLYRGVASVFLIVSLVGFAFSSAATMAEPLTLGYQQLAVRAQGVATANAALSAHYSAPQWIFLLLLLGVFIEEAFVPLHNWFPDAIKNADTGTAMLVGGVLTKTGAYALLRFGVGMMPADVKIFTYVLATVGIGNLLYGAFAAWSARDWRRLISFSSISHMGLVLFAIGTMQADAIQGAMFLLVSSGLITSLLLLTTSRVKARTLTLEWRQLSGLAKPLPILSGFLLFGALATLGLPLTSGFIGEFQSFFGGFAVHPTFAFIGLLGLILSAVYSLTAIRKTTFGPFTDRAAAAAYEDARMAEWWPIALLTMLVLFIGIVPYPLGHVFLSAVHRLLPIGG